MMQEIKAVNTLFNGALVRVSRTGFLKYVK